MPPKEWEDEADIEAAEEEEDEEEEEEEPIQRNARKARAKKRRRVTSFIDVEAAEDAEGEEEDYEDEDGDGYFYDELNEAEEARELEISQRRKLEARMKSADQLGGGHFASTVGDLERRYQDQDYATGELAEEEEEGSGMMAMDMYDTEDVSRMLPSTGGWKLWKVSVVRPGMEREACIAILSRFASLNPQQQSVFPIGAAYAPEEIRGRIYVEALSPLHIRDALKDIRSLLLSRNSISLVPAKEMADVFRMSEYDSSIMPKRGEWARFARGLYSGDLCLVSDINEMNQTITVRVVPRINLNYEIKALNSENKLPPLKTRPIACCVTLSDLEIRGIEAERVNDIAESFRFRGYVIEETTGYLLKTTKLSQLTTGENVRPTSVEIELFTNGRDLSDLLGGIAMGQANYDHQFMVGQRIWIIKGDLIGVSGTCTAIEGNRIRIQPDDSSLTSILVESSLCVKRFDMGESVKIVSGHNEGDIGLITKLDVKDGTASVLSTETHRQINCQLFQLTSVPHDTITPVGFTKIDGYTLGDLVQLSTSLQVGTIIKIYKSRRIEILTKEGHVTCDISQLSGKKTIKLVHALDSQNIQFTTGSSVEILEGPHVKKIGTVKYIWKDSVFIQVGRVFQLSNRRY